jgi:tRNA(Arg) A34 adenosine deaminase TadA
VLTAPEAEFVLRTVALAMEARRSGNHPFGALVADTHGTVLVEARNSVVTGADPTGHAELTAVRAVGARPADELATCTLFSSTEPCAMCAGGIYWSGLGRVVYALAETELLEFTGTDPRNPTMALECRAVFAAGSRPVQVVGPVDLPEARAVHEGFWSR